MSAGGADGRGPPTGNAFLLAQLGAYATARFAERVSRLDLSPAHTGVLRLASQQPGQSQQALAARLGVVPSKIVTLVDDLETRGLVERRKSATDRRNYALHLTEPGEHVLAELGTVARQHEQDITASLSETERRQLTALLQKIAAQHGLSPGVHPGYRGR